MGYKPKQYSTPKGMTQEQSRNMKTKYRFTESFDNFDEDDKWSIKRYGNAHALYDNGVLVGYDDKSIGEDYGIEGNFYNIELVYDTENIVDFGLYIVDGVDIQEIAKEFSNKVYRQGFIVKIL